MVDKFYNLAELIKLMALDVSKEQAHWKSESVSAALGLFESDLYFDEILVMDDGECRCVTIGDMRGKISRVNGRDIKEEEHKGFVRLYNEHSPFYYPCFPTIEEIAKRLKLIADKKFLTDPLVWYQKQDKEALEYYAKVVTEHTEVLERIGKTPKELFDSCQ